MSGGNSSGLRLESSEWFSKYRQKYEDKPLSSQERFEASMGWYVRGGGLVGPSPQETAHPSPSSCNGTPTLWSPGRPALPLGRPEVYVPLKTLKSKPRLPPIFFLSHAISKTVPLSSLTLLLPVLVKFQPPKIKRVPPKGEKMKNCWIVDFDSSNEVFWCTECNAKTSALCKVPFLRKQKQKRQNGHFWPFWFWNASELWININSCVISIRWMCYQRGFPVYFWSRKTCVLAVYLTYFSPVLELFYHYFVKKKLFELLLPHTLGFAIHQGSIEKATFFLQQLKKK